MLKKISTVFFATIIGLSIFSVSHVLAQDEAQKNAETICRQYAEEDNVPASEMDSYMQQCISEYTSTQESDQPDLDTNEHQETQEKGEE